MTEKLKFCLNTEYLNQRAETCMNHLATLDCDTVFDTDDLITHCVNNNLIRGNEKNQIEMHIEIFNKERFDNLFRCSPLSNALKDLYRLGSR